MAAEATTREALIRALKEAGGTSVGDMVVGDGAISQLYLHCSLTVYSQELTVFLGYNNMQLMSDLCDWYDCRESWTYRTKNMGLMRSRECGSTCLELQPITDTKHTTQDAIGVA